MKHTVQPTAWFAKPIHTSIRFGQEEITIIPSLVCVEQVTIMKGGTRALHSYKWNIAIMVVCLFVKHIFKTPTRDRKALKRKE